MIPHISEELDLAVLAQEREVANAIDLIVSCERELVLLRRRLNDVLPLSRVPDDVLIEVLFHFVSDAHHASWEWISDQKFPSSSYPEISPKPRPWWDVMLVCHRWWNIIWHTPRLWTFIHLFDPPSYVRAALARSKNAQLHLGLFTPPEGIKMELFDLMLKELPRTYFLDYTFIPSRVEKQRAFVDLGTCTAPLRTVYLKSFGSRKRVEDRINDDPLMRSLLSAPTLPKLATATLHHLPLRASNITTRPTLTSLEIQNDGYVDSFLETPLVLKLLAGLPSLENLYLRFSPPPNTTSDQLPHVDLPRLKVLRLHSHDTNCTDILEHISFPPLDGAFIGMHHSGFSSNPDFVRRLMRRLRDLHLVHLPAPYKLLLERGVKYGYFDDSYTAKIWSMDPTAPIPTTPTALTEPYLEILSIPAKGTRILPFWKPVLECLPLENVTVAGFSNASPVAGSGSFRQILNDVQGPCKMAKLKSVFFRGQRPTDFLWDLTVHPPEESWTPDVFLPQLERLELVRLEVTGYTANEFSRKLCNALGSRKSAQHPVARLTWDQGSLHPCSFCIERGELEYLQTWLEGQGILAVLRIPIRAPC